MMSKKEESFIDLECVICQSIPEPQSGNLHIFSCQQHHLLCHSCLIRVNLCPGMNLKLRNYFSFDPLQ